jgi:hypothetical protein
MRRRGVLAMVTVACLTRAHAETSGNFVVRWRVPLARLDDVRNALPGITGVEPEKSGSGNTKGLPQFVVVLAVLAASQLVETILRLYDRRQPGTIIVPLAWKSWRARVSHMELL